MITFDTLRTDSCGRRCGYLIETRYTENPPGFRHRAYGRYWEWRAVATRDGELLGPFFPWKRYATEAERDAAVAAFKARKLETHARPSAARYRPQNRVYTWLDGRRARYMVAARNRSQAAFLAGAKFASDLCDFAETDDPDLCRIARSTPGRVIAR